MSHVIYFDLSEIHAIADCICRYRIQPCRLQTLLLNTKDEMNNREFYSILPLKLTPSSIYSPI